ncbi:hypothetical protein EDM59_04135 [Brevibacillus nitrificans]|uniref:BIG2 domain-containing protein n=1 Tax=Brevibacillus nitrificans TaxID=651560 RepID=A0A3M8DJM2_9BACL|nr:hypothetical protein [Brevibacillus nitrificans]RNB88322.1 hypothetical protein EDM59_04135 [Brevibacillus nitrificans]
MNMWMLSKVMVAAVSGFFMFGDVTETESSGGSEAVNHAPALTEKMPDVETISPWVEYKIDVSEVFSDADGDELIYSALSQSEAVAKVEVEGSLVKVMAQKPGEVTIIVTASDQKGGTASTAYRYKITE